MSDVVDELANEDGLLGKSHIEERLVDWKGRVLSLYDRLSDWLPPRLSADRLTTVRMHEILMKAYDVAAIDMPVLTIHAGEHRLGRLVPAGLWIIGTNGRLNFFTDEAQWHIVDRSELFATPRWEITPAFGWDHIEALSAETWRKALGA